MNDKYELERAFSHLFSRLIKLPWWRFIKRRLILAELERLDGEIRYLEDR